MSSMIQHACDSIPEFKQRYEKFLKELQVRQYSPCTVSSYSYQLSAICSHFGKLPEDLSSDDCRDYFSMLLSRTPSPGISKFKHVVYSLRSYRSLMNLSDLPFSLPRIRQQKKLPMVFSREEVQRLLSNIDGLRCRAIFSLMYSCGLRLSELIHMKPEHIDSDRMQVFIRQGKGKKDRYVPLSRHALPVLRAYFVKYSPKVYLFNGFPGQPISEETVRALFREAVLMAGIRKPCTLHTLRHSYATHLLEMGENILRIRDLLGHTDIKTTLTYLHITRLPEGGKAFSPLDRLFPEGDEELKV